MSMYFEFCVGRTMAILDESEEVDTGGFVASCCSCSWTEVGWNLCILRRINVGVKYLWPLFCSEEHLRKCF